jgi:hypothetical protein
MVESHEQLIDHLKSNIEKYKRTSDQEKGSGSKMGA